MITQPKVAPLMTENQALLEQAELDTLIENGTEFSVPKRSLLRFLGKKERTFKLQQPFLGTLDHLSRQHLLLTFDKTTFEGNPIEESKHVVQQNAKRCARIVAIAVLNSHWKISLYTGFLSWYLLWRLRPEELFMLTITINRVSNLGDFINSIRLMSVAPRTTAPALMENPETNQPA